MVKPKRGMFNKNVYLVCVVVFIVTAAYACVLKYMQQKGFFLQDGDTEIYTNLVFNIVHSKGYHSDVLHNHHLGEHFSPIMLIISLIYIFKATPLGVLMVLGVAYGAALSVAFLLFKTILAAQKGYNEAVPRAKSAGHTTLLAVIFVAMLFFARPLSAALASQFHPSTLAVPFIFLCLLALHRGKNVLLAVSLAFLFITKENSALSVMGIGLYSYLILGRKKLAVGLIVLGLVYALLVFKVIMPHFQTAGWHHYSRLDVLYDLPKKGKYLIYLFGCFAFLPLFAPRALLCALPLIVLNLIVNFESQYTLNEHYDDSISVFLAVAAVHGFMRCKDLFGNLSRAKIIVVILVFLTPFAIFNKNYLKFQDLSRAVSRSATEDVKQLRAELAPYIEDKKITIATHRALGAYFCAREGYYRIDSASLIPGLPAGTLIVASPIVNMYGTDSSFFDDLAKSKSLELVHQSPVLFVYKKN